MFLYEKLEAVKEFGGLLPMPRYIQDNLSDRVTLRDYQTEAFQRFITYVDNGGQRKDKPVHLLFHMATGSGKTLIMAGLILHLYKQGYRNFLFFVNAKNIVEKTKENFLNRRSSKYLFAEPIEIDGDTIQIKEVDNFQNASGFDINVCFTTTQKLHTALLAPKENSLTLEDFMNEKMVMISDESHHVNTLTKKGKEEAEAEQSWEYSVNRVFTSNKSHVLLEFTATCDLKDPNVLAKYKDKIIFDYPLAKFRAAKYTKDFANLQSDYGLWERTLVALVLSQYRQKLFADIKQPIKPVILLKSQKITESEAFYELFLDRLGRLIGSEIAALDAGGNPALKACFDYLERQNISPDMLVEELRMAFSEEHCIIMNGMTDNSVEKQLAVNSLEDARNPYRLIFTVDMLNEGWDVLNLFDIVRLYDTRQSGGRKISPYTIKEAQLIGRGARYCPFAADGGQDRYRRKYDEDMTHELRLCETLYYHCRQDSRYIDELRSALKETGLLPESRVEVRYTVKEAFKKEEIYKTGFVFANRRIEKSGQPCAKLDKNLRSLVVSVSAATGGAVIYGLFDDSQADGEIKKHKTSVQMKEVPYSIAYDAMCGFNELQFDKLRRHFPHLKSAREFLTSTDYLGHVAMHITSAHAPASGADLHMACVEVFRQVAPHISGIERTFGGSEDFQAKYLREVVKDKTRYIENPRGDGEGISQRLVDPAFQLDLSVCDWYVYNDNYGTTEEKKFVFYFSHVVDELKRKYDKVYLIRNERFAELAMFDFDTGERLEADYLLILQKANGKGMEQRQISVEPKGEGFMPKDEWKERFLLQLEQRAVAVKMFADDNAYTISGLPFFNAAENQDAFSAAIRQL